MTAVKRNKSKKLLGKGRGVPMRLARGIARRYGLSHLVILTCDRQERSRILYWAQNDLRAMQCASLCRKIADLQEWSELWNWDCSSVRRLKERIKNLEYRFALIFEGEGDPKEIARDALRLPKDV